MSQKKKNKFKKTLNNNIKEIIYSLIIFIVFLISFSLIFYYSLKRTIWDGISVFSMIGLSISIIFFAFVLLKDKNDESYFRKIKKLFVIKENENLKLNKQEKILMRMLDDDLKPIKEKKTNVIDSLNNLNKNKAMIFFAIYSLFGLIISLPFIF